MGGRFKRVQLYAPSLGLINKLEEGKYNRYSGDCCNRQKAQHRKYADARRQPSATLSSASRLDTIAHAVPTMPITM